MRRSDAVYLGLLAFGCLASTAIGLAGIDFGSHWDEANTLDEVVRAVRTGLLLPRWYNYPDFTFDLAMAALVPSAARSWVAHGFDVDQAAKALLAYVDTEDYHFRLRRLCLILTELGSFGAAGAMLALGFRVRDGAICGLILLSSWQVGYHARWIAPDTIMMSAAALFIPVSVAACRLPNGLAWSRAAALLLGLVVSCKYPGGLLLIAFLPCFYLRLVHVDGWPRGKAIRAVAACMGIAAAAFLALTPGAYVEPFRFLDDINTERLHYTVAGHGAHTIEAIRPRTVAVLRFLLVSCFSPYAPLAWSFAIFVPLGAVRLFRRDRIAFAVVVGPTLLAILYFSSVKVVIVRNYLFVFPYVAVLAAIGVSAVLDRLPSPASRSIGVALPLIAVAANLLYGASAARSISDRDAIDFGASLKAYIERHPGGRIYVAPSALRLAGLSASALPEAAPSLASSDHVVYDADQFDWDHQYSRAELHGLLNRPGLYATVAGPREVDWDYYPDWVGNRRLLTVLTKDYERLAAFGASPGP